MKSVDKIFTVSFDVRVVNVFVFHEIWVRLSPDFNNHALGHHVFFFGQECPPPSKSEGARTPMYQPLSKIIPKCEIFINKNNININWNFAEASPQSGFSFTVSRSNLRLEVSQCVIYIYIYIYIFIYLLKTGLGILDF